jgi:hypothetical protein
MPVETKFAPLQARIDRLRMKRAHVWALTSISAGMLSQAASGQTDLGYVEFREIERLLDSCEEIQRRAEPVPVDWQNIAQIRVLLAELRDEKTPPEPALEDLDLFRRFTAGEDLDQYVRVPRF